MRKSVKQALWSPICTHWRKRMTRFIRLVSRNRHRNGDTSQISLRILVSCCFSAETKKSKSESSVFCLFFLNQFRKRWLVFDQKSKFWKRMKCRRRILYRRTKATRLCLMHSTIQRLCIALLLRFSSTLLPTRNRSMSTKRRTKSSSTHTCLSRRFTLMFR